MSEAASLETATIYIFGPLIVLCMLLAIHHRHHTFPASYWSVLGITILASLLIDAVANSSATIGNDGILCKPIAVIVMSAFIRVIAAVGVVVGIVLEMYRLLRRQMS
ncbi:hypothetical protein [Phyllobacterium calauticae]|jgi:hypothetical protein|uniref:hypothetical protein n=1 Tax=Phyllobacterium calauticae TaxID=2817027 RepID=UPI001CBADBE2|nr:hypothetical protein [Phyllobacterium calauticae]MBZ3694411.1 hypothetical protein [Phyllobacterium calauticae]